MNKESLAKRFRKKLFPCFMAVVLVFVVFFICSCADEFVAKKPVAMFIADPTEGDARLEVTFDGSLSYVRMSGTHIEKYLWDFGDGETSTSGAWVTHVYERGGEYNARLIVVDNEGRESEAQEEKIIVHETLLGQIAFWSNFREGVDDDDIYSGNIVIRDDNIELLDLERLTTDPGQDLQPTWSPDGDQIVFVSYREGYSTLYLMNADGTDQKKLTYDIAYAAHPDWGSNGKILFTYMGSGSAGIATINPDGTEFTKLIEQPVSGSMVRLPINAKYSPDCSKIAFSAHYEGQWDIYVMDADGTNQVNLTAHSAKDQTLAWSPDGNQIVFGSSRMGCGFDLFIMNVDGTDAVNLTNTFYDSEDIMELTPAWSPDGEWIAYGRGGYRICDEEGNMIGGGGIPVISIIKPDGTNTVILGEYYGTYPSWRPKKK